jgi:hypothetical protein
MKLSNDYRDFTTEINYIRRRFGKHFVATRKNMIEAQKMLGTPAEPMRSASVARA